MSQLSRPVGVADPKQRPTRLAELEVVKGREELEGLLG